MFRLLVEELNAGEYPLVFEIGSTAAKTPPFGRWKFVENLEIEDEGNDIYLNV